MFFLFLVDKGAHFFYWYNSIWYFDMLMHFGGGFWVGLFFIYIFSSNQSFSKIIFRVFLSVLIVGALWEVFEFFMNNVIGRVPFDIFDTTLDIFFDLIGGLFSLLYFFKRIMPMSVNKI